MNWLPPGAVPPRETRRPIRRIPSPRFSLRGLISAIPDFGFSGFFILTWIDPHRFGVEAVSFCMLTMILEFIIVHSSGFMSLAYAKGMTWRHKIGIVLGLGVVYTIFVAGFSLAFNTWWPVWTFWLLTANRMAGVLLNPSQDSLIAVMAGWVLGVIFYLFGVFLTVLGPVPRLGITDEVVAQLGHEGSGLWEEQPWRVMAFGAIYFALQGVAGLFLIGGPKGEPDSEAPAEQVA